MKQKEKGEKGKENKNLPSGCEYQDFFLCRCCTLFSPELSKTSEYILSVSMLSEASEVKQDTQCIF